MMVTTEALVAQAFPVSASAWVVRLKGSVDASNVEKLRGAVAYVFERGISRVAIDLEGVDFMSSSAFGCLIGAHEQAERSGGRLVFTGASLAVREVFRMLGLLDVLRTAPTLEEGLRQL